jgi:hypothetical protein
MLADSWLLGTNQINVSIQAVSGARLFNIASQICNLGSQLLRAALIATGFGNSQSKFKLFKLMAPLMKSLLAA